MTGILAKAARKTIIRFAYTAAVLIPVALAPHNVVVVFPK